MKWIICKLIIIMVLSSSFSVYGSPLDLRKMIPQSNANGFDLVIIAPEHFSLRTQPLIEHKNDQGISTFLKTTEDIYAEYPGADNAEQIKYFIKDAIEKNGICFVLLVGGADFIPGRYTHIFYDGNHGYSTPDEWMFPSDFYYADIYDDSGSFSSWDSNGNGVFAEYNWDGNTDVINLIPDIAVGRLPCVSEDQLTTIISKIITYENNRYWASSSFRDIIFIGGDSLPGDDERIDEGEFVHTFIMDRLPNFNHIKIWASLGQLNRVDTINNAMNKGCGFVFFNGHGNIDIWCTYRHESYNDLLPPGGYRNSHIASLSNGDNLPIIISDACYHCQYDRYSDCFGWKFLTNEHGGGIAFIGGSDVDLSFGGSRIISKGVEKLGIEFSQILYNGSEFLGELLKEALQNYYLSSDVDEVDIITILENHLFGDPSLRIGDANHPPDPPVIQGPNTVKINTLSNYSIVSIDPDSDDIYYQFDWGDDISTDWLGPYESNHVCISSHAWVEKGAFAVRARAKDSLNAESQWVTLEVSIPKTNSFHLYLRQRYPFLSCFLTGNIYTI